MSACVRSAEIANLCHQWRGTACAYSEVEEKALLAELSAAPGGPRTRGGCKASAQGRFQE